MATALEMRGTFSLDMLTIGAGGLFIDSVEWVTTGLDVGSSSNGYTFGGLIIILSRLLC